MFLIFADYSGQSYYTYSEYPRVIQNHQRFKQFVCHSCQKSYSYERGLTQHIRYECGKEPQFICPKCPYKCHRKESFVRHCWARHDLNARELNYC